MAKILGKQKKKGILWAIFVITTMIIAGTLMYKFVNMIDSVPEPSEQVVCNVGNYVDGYCQTGSFKFESYTGTFSLGVEEINSLEEIKYNWIYNPIYNEHYNIPSIILKGCNYYSISSVDEIEIFRVNLPDKSLTQLEKNSLTDIWIDEEKKIEIKYHPRNNFGDSFEFENINRSGYGRTQSQYKITSMIGFEMTIENDKLCTGSD